MGWYRSIGFSHDIILANYECWVTKNKEKLSTEVRILDSKDSVDGFTCLLHVLKRLSVVNIEAPYEGAY